jgi:muconolactone delta-isomerase
MLNRSKGKFTMKFLVESWFAQAPPPEVLALIPAEVAHGRQFDMQGARLALYIAQDQSRAWQLYQADSVDAVQRIVASFPLHPYLATKITPLAENPF